MTNQRKAGVLLGYAAMFLQIAIGFLYLPVLFRFLSKEEYGLYQLMGSLVAYVSLMDFGLGSTLMRYYARAIEAGDNERQENLLAMGLIIFLIIALAAGVFGGILYMGIEPVYGVQLSALELHKAKLIFIVLIMNMMISLPCSIIDAIVVGQERFIYHYSISIVSILTSPFVTILAVMFTPSALSIAIVTTLVKIACRVVSMFYCSRRLHVRIRLHRFEGPLAKEMLVFSSFLFMNTIVEQVFWRTDQLILGALAGTAAVAVYSIAANLETYYQQFSQRLSTNVFIAQITRLLYRNDDMTEVNAIFNKVGRLQLFLVALILTGFIAFGEHFIVFWVGESYRPAYIMALIVMIPLLIPLIQNLSNTIMRAKNMHRFQSILGLGTASLNIVVSLYLGRIYGGYGCAIGTAISLTIGNIIIMNIYYHKRVGIDIISFARNISSMLSPVIITLVLGLVLVHFLPPSGLLMIGLEIGIYLLIYIGLMWLMGLNAYEKNLGLSLIKKLNVWQRK